jgi:predicted ATPase
MSRPYNIAFSLLWAAVLHQFRREANLTQERAETAITLSIEQRFPQWVAVGSLLGGWALVEQGHGEEGIARMRRRLAASRTAGEGAFSPYSLALLAEAYGKAGRAEDGLAALAEALTVVDNSGERFYEAELYRLKGELTLKQSSVQSLESRVKEAEECFHHAIDIAYRQSAKSLELRATMSLSRLWQQQGKKEEARQMLAEIYGWFTEGFETKDLQEAKALLAELAEDR